jgi:hypothetical protein
MSTPFRWPSQLQAVEVKDSTPLDAPRRFVLVRKKPDPKTGKQKTSSSSNGVIDVAVAVKLGLVPATGLPGLLSHLNHKKVLRLLKHNTITLVKPKHATTKGIHATKATLKLAEEGLSAVLCPAYWKANQDSGIKAALKTTKIILWIKANLENPNSNLCNSLLDTPFEDLIGVKHSRRWWLDRLAIRKSAE